MSSQSVICVSKNIVPPYTDGTKVLVKALAQSMGGSVRCFSSDASIEHKVPGVLRSTHELTKTDLLFLSHHLLFTDRHVPLHFFFTPTKANGIWGRWVRRGRKCIQTVTSFSDAVPNPMPHVCGEHIVTVSKFGYEKFLSWGLDPERLSWIKPCFIPPMEADLKPGRPWASPYVLFAGDIDFDVDVPTWLTWFANASPALNLCIATRPKTTVHQQKKSQWNARIHELGLASRVKWIGESGYFHAWLKHAEMLLLPSPNYHAKLDIPLVLLESLWLGTPVMIHAEAPSNELLGLDGVHAYHHETDFLNAIAHGTGERCAPSLDEYMPNRVAKEYLALYNRLGLIHP